MSDIDGENIHRSPVRAAAALALTFLLVSPLGAQERAAELCRGCTIQRTLVATLGDSAEPVLLDIGSIPIRQSSGKFVVFSFQNGALISYTASGAFEKATGRRGSGPGEFSDPGILTLGIGDSILIRQRARIDVFSPDLRYVRSVALPATLLGLNAVVQLANGTLMGWWPAARGTDFIHLLLSNGQHHRSVGAARLPDTTCQRCQARIISVLRGTEFVALAPTDLGVEIWTANGELRKAFRLTSPWFMPAPVPSGVGVLPAPAVVGATVDAAGQLWVAGSVPNARSRPPAGSISMRGSTGGRASAVPVRSPGAQGDIDLSGQTAVVEVVDLMSGQSLATTRFEGEAVGMFPGGYAYTRRQDDSGVVRLDVWRLTLIRP